MGTPAAAAGLAGGAGPPGRLQADGWPSRHQGRRARSGDGQAWPGAQRGLGQARGAADHHRGHAGGGRGVLQEALARQVVAAVLLAGQAGTEVDELELVMGGPDQAHSSSERGAGMMKWWTPWDACDDRSSCS